MDGDIVKILFYIVIGVIYLVIKGIGKRSEKNNPPAKPSQQPTGSIDDMLDDWMKKLNPEQQAQPQAKQKQEQPNQPVQPIKAKKKPAYSFNEAMPKDYEVSKQRNYENYAHEERVKRHALADKMEASKQKEEESSPIEDVLEDDFDARKAFIYHTIFEKKHF